MEPEARCLTCNDGHKSDGNGGCELCSSDECCLGNTTFPITSHCISCDDDGNGCGKCSKGYYIDDDDGYSCVKCENNTCCPGNTHNPVDLDCFKCADDGMSCYSCPINTKLMS